MRTVLQSVSALSLIGVGYFFGATGFFVPQPLTAQVGTDGPSENTAEKIAEADIALHAAMEALRNDGLYKSATKELNTFAIMTGGVDALRDLEDGRGVDPETFAALYADQAIDQVAQQLSKDDQGKITYKGQPIRMYPISRLKALYQVRLKYTSSALP